MMDEEEETHHPDSLGRKLEATMETMAPTEKTETKSKEEEASPKQKGKEQDPTERKSNMQTRQYASGKI